MALIDLKHLYRGRTINISFAQRRLLEAISREPTAHLYSREYMARHGLTKGGIWSGLRALKKRALVGQEDGGWRVQPPEMRKWLEVLHDHGPAAAENFRWWSHLRVEELVSKITPENKHDYSDTDFGKPVGKEEL